MRLPPLPFVVLDTETTGFVPRTHRVIEFACVRVSDGKVEAEYEQLYSVPGDIPSHIQVLTRIKPASLAGKPAFESLRHDILTHTGGEALLVGQNLGFDLGMLKGEGIDLTERAWVDTSMLASLMFPELRSYSLQYLSTTLKLHHEPVHRALGDVRATLELFSKIWERLCDLPADKRARAKDILSRSTEGYRRLAAHLPDGEPAGTVFTFPSRTVRDAAETAAIPLAPAKGTLTLREESLHADHLQGVLRACATPDAHTHWIAVKNLEATLRRVRVPDGVRVLYPPQLLLDPGAAARMVAQETYTGDEATLAIKISWFAPRLRSDLALHGGEKDTWNGKLACTEKSAAYTEQFATKAHTFLLDHRQLLQFLENPQTAAHGLLTPDAHIIVDDASMLEDTATKAFGVSVFLDDLRGAAQGNARLMSMVDLAAIWAERLRGDQDLKFLSPDIVATPETRGLTHHIQELLGDTELPERTVHLLNDLLRLLGPQPDGQLLWIEKRMDGSISMHSAPEHVDRRLETSLYGSFATTLLVPAGSTALPETVPLSAATQLHAALPPSPENLTVSFPLVQASDIFTNPPEGKTIVLLPSKHFIEKMFIDFTEALESRGITLICQGLSGGLNRMEADFLASPAPALLVLTPWMYEGCELPPESVDHLVIDTLPFDNPNQPVFSRRKNHFRDAFMDYSLPRVEHRVFRLVRTFCRHRTGQADIQVLDKRLHEKEYGKRLKAYLMRLAGDLQAVDMPAKATVRKALPKEPPAQQSLF